MAAIKKEYLKHLCSIVNLIRVKHEPNPWPYVVIYYKGYVNIEIKYSDTTIKVITTGTKVQIAAFLNGMINAYNGLKLNSDYKPDL